MEEIMGDTLAQDMYREHILELFKEPHNYGTLANATHECRAHNPLCGDDIAMQARIVSGTVHDVLFKGSGCALSMASASLLTDEVKGKTVHKVMTWNREDVLRLMDIPVGPVRLKCVLLPLEALQGALSRA